MLTEDLTIGLPPLGHNNPPDPVEEIRTRLAETHGPLLSRKDELLAMGDRIPAACDDDETAKKIADAIKACMAFQKYSESARTAAKEPHLAAGRAVDGWFASLKDPVDKVRARLAALLTAYQRKVEAEERARREAEAARLRAEAAEADRKRREAERLRREAEALARKAEQDKAQAQADAAAAEERAREAKAEADRAKEEANRARQAAEDKPAELTRQRSDLGSVASLKRTWDYRVEDEALVPRMYLTIDHSAIRAAIRSSTDKKTGECRLKIQGVSIFEKLDTAVR